MKRLALALLIAGGCAAPSPIERRSSLRIYDVGACTQLSWPVEGPVSSLFGVRDGRPHEGIDLAVPEDTPVRAACDGVVAYAGDRLRGYGRLVILDHGGLVTVYAHNRRLLVREGERVERGATVARSGQTGRATAPHVHFEVRLAGRPVDPIQYLDGPNRAVEGAHSRRAGLSQAGDPLQRRDAAPRGRRGLPHLR